MEIILKILILVPAWLLVFYGMLRIMDVKARVFQRVVQLTGITCLVELAMGLIATMIPMLYLLTFVGYFVIMTYVLKRLLIIKLWKAMIASIAVKLLSAIITAMVALVVINSI